MQLGYYLPTMCQSESQCTQLQVIVRLPTPIPAWTTQLYHLFPSSSFGPRGYSCLWGGVDGEIKFAFLSFAAQDFPLMGRFLSVGGETFHLLLPSPISSYYFDLLPTLWIGFQCDFSLQVHPSWRGVSAFGCKFTRLYFCSYWIFSDSSVVVSQPMTFVHGVCPMHIY